jgi:hypothetical protein
MTSPHYVNEDKSDMRGIKHGWYAMEDDEQRRLSRNKCQTENT